MSPPVWLQCLGCGIGLVYIYEMKKKNEWVSEWMEQAAFEGCLGGMWNGIHLRTVFI